MQPQNTYFSNVHSTKSGASVEVCFFSLLNLRGFVGLFEPYVIVNS